MCFIYHTLFDYYLNLCYTNLVILAGVAQSVAHLIGSEEVTGSIPVASSRASYEQQRRKRRGGLRVNLFMKDALLFFF